MEAEILIISGVMLIVSGMIWLILEPHNNKKIINSWEIKSITEIYRKLKLQGQLKYFSNLTGLLLIIICIAGWYKYGLYKNYVLTGLSILTLSWYQKAKTSWLQTAGMMFFTLVLGYFNTTLGLFWLLTVIGSGYYNPSQMRNWHNNLVQLAVLVNPVSSIAIHTNPLVNNKLEEGVPKLISREMSHEGLINCPICQETMKLFNMTDGEEKIIYDQCPKCQAIFFDDRDHGWAIHKIAEGRRQKTDIRDQKANTKIICPRCEIAMKNTTNKLDPKNVTVYSCTECLGNLLV